MSSAPQLASKQPTGVRWLIFGLACLTSWFLYIHRYAWGVIKPDVAKEFGFSDKQLGVLDSCFSFSYAAGQVPGGWLGDTFGPALVLPIMVAAWSVVLGLMCVVSGYYSIMGVRLGFGATQAGCYPNLGKVSKSWFPSSIRTTLQGFVASFSGRMGGAAAPLLLSTVLMGSFGLTWRQLLLVLMAAGIVYAIVLRLFLRNNPTEHPWSNEAEAILLEEDETPDGKQQIETRFTSDRLAWFSFSGLVLHMFTSAFADMIYVNWIPTFLEREHGLTKAAMGVFASLPLFGGAIGGVVGGVLNDRLRPRLGLKWARRLVGMTGKLVAGGLVIFSLTFDNGRQMMVVIMFAKFFTDWSQPTVWGAVTDLAGRDTGRVFGMVNMAGSIAGILAGVVLGAVIQDHGWGALFGLIAVIYLVSGLSWTIINTERPLIVEVDSKEQ